MGGKPKKFLQNFLEVSIAVKSFVDVHEALSEKVEGK